MKAIAILLAPALMAGCAVIRYADGERVAIEHENPDVQQLQAKADQACKDSGGHGSARLASNIPVNPSLPAGMSRMVATYRCG